MTQSWIHDFREGVQYTVYSNGQCLALPFNNVKIGNHSLPYLDDFDTTNDDDHLHMKTVQQMFHATGRFNYNHQVKVRGVTSDLFTKDMKLYNQETQIRLYYAANTTTENTRGV